MDCKQIPGRLLAVLGENGTGGQKWRMGRAEPGRWSFSNVAELPAASCLRNDQLTALGAHRQRSGPSLCEYLQETAHERGGIHPPKKALRLRKLIAGRPGWHQRGDSRSWPGADSLGSVGGIPRGNLHPCDRVRPPGTPGFTGGSSSRSRTGRWGNSRGTPGSEGSRGALGSSVARCAGILESDRDSGDPQG
jgi:hypothetical protein